MRVLSVILIVAFCSGCHFVSEKTNQAINKTGQVVGEGSSEFVKGVTKGVASSLQCELIINPLLHEKGVSYGRYYLSNDTGGKKNKLTVYLIFDKEFNGKIVAKALDLNGTEYGRATINMTARAGDAMYSDFIFDSRTDVESKSKITLE